MFTEQFWVSIGILLRNNVESLNISCRTLILIPRNGFAKHFNLFQQRKNKTQQKCGVRLFLFFRFQFIWEQDINIIFGWD